MVQLDENTRKQLRKLQRTDKDKKVFVKVTVLLMLDEGFSPEMIARSLGIEDSTLYRYQKDFNEKGAELLPRQSLCGLQRQAHPRK
ncbi:MAG: helix-turn-helix domain-containing protein [Saprospirales bacterium]|nr:helix-turn-helix domain-containing protein [Saprospirales bacterium]